MGLDVRLGDNTSPNATEGGLVVQPSPLAGIDSEFTRLIKSSYDEMVALVGVPIIFGSTTKQCIAGPLKLDSALEPVGRVSESSIQVTMLAEDFDEFDVVPSVTQCTIDDVIMTVTSIQRDRQDPCVEFRAIGDH